jgi:hypothetical protein
MYIVRLAIYFICFLPLSSYAQVAFNAGGPNGGAIILGNSGDTCNASMEGALYWDGSCFQGCDGTSWECMNGACDNTPHSFTFTDITGAATSTVFESNIIQINGADPACNSVISVSGDGSPEWRLCSNITCGTEIQTWTSSNSSEDTQGNYLQIRTTSDASTNVTNTVTANVGAASNVWTVATTITGSCGATPTPGDICTDGTVYAGITPDGNLPMYISRCDDGMSSSGSACTGVRSSLPWNDDNAYGDNVVTGTGSREDGDLNTATLIVIDSDATVGGTQPHQAAQACADLNVHGYTDWYLPAYDELFVIYENLMDGSPNDNSPDPVITGFATSSYWSSSQGWAPENYGFQVNFNDGTGVQSQKNQDLHVRCARK